MINTEKLEAVFGIKIDDCPDNICAIADNSYYDTSMRLSILKKVPFLTIDRVGCVINDALRELHFQGGATLTNIKCYMSERLFDYIDCLHPSLRSSLSLPVDKSDINVCLDPVVADFKVEGTPAIICSELRGTYKIKQPNYTYCLSYMIKEVIFNPPATIIFWTDGSKTVVKCQEGDKYDKEKGLALAIVKKVYGNKSRDLNKVLKQWIPEEDESASKDKTCTTCKHQDRFISSYPCCECDFVYSKWEERK